MPLNEPPPMKI